MQFENVSVRSLAYLDAPHRVTSTEICEKLRSSMSRLGFRQDFLESLTGIVARRFWDPGVQPSQVAAQAGEQAIQRAEIDRNEIGLIVNTSVCKDYIEPSVASMVHHSLRLSSRCLNFDVGNACLAFLNGMAIAGNMIERGQINHALIVDGEGARHICERTIDRLNDPLTDDRRFRDNFASLTLGSGAVAMVLSRSDLAPDGHRFLGGVNLAASEYNQLCRGNPDEMVTDASGLLVAGLELARRTWDLAVKELGWVTGELKEYVLHQVSAVHTDRLISTLRLPHDKVHRIFPEFGNIGPASLPIALAKAAENGRIQKGDRVGLLGIGSGLNCSMMEVVW